MLLPVGAKDFDDAMKIVTECYHALKGVITEKFGITGELFVKIQP
jgi:enolase